MEAADDMAWEISWVDMCRTCMEVDGELLPLYDEDAEITENDYAYKLGKIASVEIHKYDGLPTKICDKCAYRTNAFYDFQCLIQESDRNFKEMFNAQFTSDEKNMHIVDQTSGTYDAKAQQQNQDCFSAIKEKSYDDCDKFHMVLQDREEKGAKTFTPEDSEDISNTVTKNVKENINDLVDINAKVDNVHVVFHSEELNITNSTDDFKYAYTSNDCEDQQASISFPKEVELDHQNELIDCNDFSEDYTKIVSELLDDTQMSNSSNSRVNNNNDNNGNTNNNCNDDSDSDSCGFLDNRENIVGSINDTITRIKEIKEDGKILQYQCTLCLQNYKMLFEILCHIVDLHVPSTGPFYCIVCEMDCKDIKELRAHVKTHKGPSPYTCFLCNKSYVLKRYLKRHMACHTDFPRYRCTKCGERFKVKSELESHITSNHAEEATFKCSQCTRIFNHKGNYKRHLITHLDPQGLHLPKYPCSYCNRRFLNNRMLTTHMRVHTGEKPYKCKICKKSFSQQGNLLNHSKIHTNPGSYKCDVCGKSFNQKATLRDHSLLHSGEKPYVCNVCGIAYTFGAALRRHMWSHSDGKPYECDTCKAKFIGRYDLRRHMKIHMDKSKCKQNNKSKKEKKSKADAVTITEQVMTNTIDTNPLDADTIFVEQMFLCDRDNTIQIISQGDSEKENVESLLGLIQY